MTLLEPSTLVANRYEILTLVGVGATSAVYKARNIALNKLVAIKILQSNGLQDDTHLRRFERESKVASSLDHPNLVGVHDYGLIPAPFIVMDYVEGKTLSTTIAEQGALTLALSLPLFCQLCDAIQQLHNAGIVHRDIKPSNVMLTGGNDTSVRAILIDLGLAKVFDNENSLSDDITKTDDILGSLPYMSPEQFTSESIDNRSDIYSLGCLMYESVSGKKVFDANNAMEWMVSHIQKSPALISFERKELRLVERVIFTALQKQPSDRYQSIEELKQDILRIARNKKPLKNPEVKPFPQTLLPIILGLTIVFLAFLYVEQMQIKSLIWQTLYDAGIKSSQTSIPPALWELTEASKFSDACFPPHDQHRLKSLRALIEVSEKAGNTADSEALQARLKFELGDIPSKRWLELEKQADYYWSRRQYRSYEATLLEQKKEAELIGAESLLLSQSLSALGAYYYFVVKNYSLAEKYSQDALKIRQNLFGKENELIDQNLSIIGGIRYESGHWAEAEEVERFRLQICSKLYGASDFRSIDPLVWLGKIADGKGDLAASKKLYLDALRLADSHAPNNQTFVIMSNLAGVYKKLGKVQLAYELAKKALPLAAKTTDVEHPLNLTTCLHNVAIDCVLLNKLSEAETFLLRATKVQRPGSFYEPYDPCLADDYAALAIVYRRTGREKDANAAAKKCFELYQKYPWMNAKLTNIKNPMWKRGDHGISL